MNPPTQSTERWNRIETLFAEALEHRPEERAAFLTSNCAEPDVRAELERLLRAHTQSDNFLDALDPKRVAALVASVGPTLEAGVRVGPYEVVREIGRGGMGVVFLAERVDGQFEQRVALKLVKRGLDSEAVLDRFLRERQILARLQHANVARLLDGGITADGQPYFAMEYVEGSPITAYCNSRNLDIDARLRLFEFACEAVSYAHQNLVVHRDLKPSNILVTSDGTVKLLDFGVATVLDDEHPAQVAGGRLLTPAYAAPEQTRGEPVTTAADVYALGVVLRELLTGRRPPESPSENADGDAEGNVNGDEDGSVNLHTRSGLPGDVDAIVSKALAAEPDARYASADALVADIRRYRTGFPVSVLPNTFRYRTRTFVRRHRIGVFAAILVITSLVGGLGMALWQARRAEAGRDLAEREASRAEHVAAFLTNLFYLADPNYALGETITMPAALDSAARWVDRDTSNLPEARASIALKLSEISSAIGLYDEARRLADTALAIHIRYYGEDSPIVAGTQTFMAETMRGQGRLADAEPMLRRALATRIRASGSDNLDVAYTQNMLALALRDQGQFDEADSLLRVALEISRRHALEYPIGVHRSLNNLAHVSRARGRFDDAEALHREVLALRQVYWGAEHPEVANTLVNLGITLGDQERYAEAESLLQDGLAMRRRLQGENHPEVGIDLAGLAAVQLKSGNRIAAAATYREALRLQQRTLGADHPTTIETGRRISMGEENDE